MGAAELRNVDALVHMRDALVRFRESTSNVSTQLRARVERAEAVLSRHRASLESEIEAQRSLLSESKDEDERREAGRALDEAYAALSVVRKRSRELARAVAHHSRVVTSWHNAIGTTLPAAAAYLAQKHAEATNYQRVALPGSPVQSSIGGSAEVENAVCASSTGESLLAGPAHANSPDELPKLPSGFTWIPISQFDQSELPNRNDFKKGISPSDMANGLQRLWSELIPTLNANARPSRAVCEAFDEANGRVDPMGFVHPESLSNLWDVFFNRREHIRVTFDERTEKWSIDNGRHRVRIAKDLGWKYVPGELSRPNLKGKT